MGWTIEWASAKTVLSPFNKLSSASYIHIDTHSNHSDNNVWIMRMKGQWCMKIAEGESSSGLCHPFGQIEQGTHYIRKSFDMLDAERVSGESSGRASL